MFCDEEGLGQILAKKEVWCSTLVFDKVPMLPSWDGFIVLSHRVCMHMCLLCVSLLGWVCVEEIHHPLFSIGVCVRETTAVVPEESIGNGSKQI